MTGRSKRSRKAESGFTLLELMAVLAVLAFAATLFLPRAGGARDRVVLRAAALDVASAARTARTAALRSNRAQLLSIDSEARRYWIEGVRHPHRVPSGVALSLETPLSDGEPGIGFRPDGSATGGKVRLSAPGASAVIEVDWLTGRTSARWTR
jgi:general secretion pathway protein H